MQADDLQITEFLTQQCGLSEFSRTPLAHDMSSRRYERIKTSTHTFILMNTTHPDEDIDVFDIVGSLLRSVSHLSAPQIFEKDIHRGLAILEDFGDQTFGRLLASGEDEESLYKLAVNTLIVLHKNTPPRDILSKGLRHYNSDRFLSEVMFFIDVGLPLYGIKIPDRQRQEFEALWRRLIPQALDIPQSLLLRDFHVENLMLLKNRLGVRACGLLDFQMAGLGPNSYDLVSLLEDARRDLTPGLAESMLEHYLSAFPGIDRQNFEYSYSILGALRHTRIVAILLRIGLQQGKAHYLQHLPRVWTYLNAQLEKPFLKPLLQWFDINVPAKFRTGVIPERVA